MSIHRTFSFAARPCARLLAVAAGLGLAAGAAVAQERIYLAQLNPPQIHAYELTAGSLVHQPDGGAPLVPGAEAWNLAATDTLLLAGIPLAGVGFRALSPDGVLTPPVEGATVSAFAGLFVIGDYAVVVGSSPPAVSVVDFDPSSASFMSELTALGLGGGQADGQSATLSPDGMTLYVARTRAASPATDTLIDAIDVSALPALNHLHTTAIPNNIWFNRVADALRSFSLGGQDYLALFRRDVQFLAIDPSLAPQLTVTTSFGHPSPNAATLRRLYDGVFDAATARAVVTCDTEDDSGAGTAFHELLVLDLSLLGDATPSVSLAAQVETESPFTHLTSGSQELARSLDGATLYHLTEAQLPGDPHNRLRAYDMTSLLAGAGDVPLAAVELDTVTIDPGAPTAYATGLLVHDRVVSAISPPLIADAVLDGESDPAKQHVLPNDSARTIRLSGSLAGVSRAFLGSKWLSGVVADGADLLATMAALTPAGDLPIGVIGGSGGMAAIAGLVKVVNPPQFLPAAVAYVADFAGNSVTVLNSSSETEVVGSFASGAQGPGGVEVSPDGNFLFVSGFRDATVAAHCLVAGAKGLPCDWNDVAATIALHPFAAGGDMELSAAGDRLFVNELWPGITVVDTTTVPPSPLGRIAISTEDDNPWRGVHRALALERSPTPPGEWLYVADDLEPHIDALDVSGIAGDYGPGGITEISVPGLPAGRARSDGLAVSPDGSRLFFTNFWSTAVTVCSIDPFDGSNVDCSGSLAPIPLTTADADVRHLAVSPDGRFLYVTARGAGTTEVIEIAASPTCGSPPCAVASLATGPGSNGLRVSPSGEYVFVAVSGIDAVAVIRRDATAPFHTLLTTSSTGLSPVDVVLTPGVATGAGADVTVTPTQGVQVQFDDVTGSGNTVVTSANTSSVPLPADFAIGGSGVAVYYDVSTSATFDGLVTVCFDYDDSAMTPAEEAALVLLHEETCSALLDAAGAAGCDPGGYGSALLTDYTEFTCTASGVSKGDCAAGQEGSPRTRFITQTPVDTVANRLCGRVGHFSQFVAAVRVVWPVTVDIRPGVSPNVVNTRAKGKIEVAILSDDEIDATTIDVGSVRLAGIAVHSSPDDRDVDFDGRLDRIVKFEIQELGLAPGIQELELTGETVDGRAIRGADTVEVK